MEDDLSQFLQETFLINFSNPMITDFVEEAVRISGKSKTDQCVNLFYKVRDEIIYNPYYVNASKEECKASMVLERGFGHCIDKASLLISACRAIDVPARLGLAKVQNHIATERLEEYLGSNVLVPHGYVEVFLNEHWWKITPAFNQSLCVKLNVATLDFHGANHCLFQEFDKNGKHFMQYLEDYGTFADIPLNFILELMKKNYPKLRTVNSDGVVYDLTNLSKLG